MIWSKIVYFLKHSFPLWNRIKFKLLLFGITMSILPIAILGWYNIEISKQSLEESVQERQIFVAERASTQVNELIISLKGRMELLIDANNTTDINGSEIKARWEQSLYSFLKQNYEIENAYLFDEFGSIIAFASRWETRIPEKITDIEYKRIKNQLEKNQDSFIGNVRYKDDGSPIVDIGVPFYSTKTNRFNGGLIIEVNLRSTFNKALSILTGDNGYSFIIDENQRLIAHTDFSQVILEKEVIASKELDEVINERNVKSLPIQYTSYTGKNVIGIYRPIPSSNWGVVIEHPLETAYLPIYTLVKRLLLTMIVIMSLVGLISIIFGFIFTKPIELLEKAVQKVTSGNLDTKINYPSSDEFGKLANAFNHMTDELRTKSRHLELEKERLDTIINGSGAGFALVNDHYQVVWMNNRLQNWLNTENVGLSCYSLLGNLAEPCKDCPLSDHDLQKCQDEVINTIDHNGKSKIFSHKMYPLDEVKTGEKQYLIVVEDITEQRQLEEMVVQADKLSALGILASGFAHEVNNPLASISVYAEDLMERLKEESPQELVESGEVNHYLDTIKQNVDRCKTITGGLLHFSRKPNLQTKNLDVAKMVKDSLLLIHHSLKKKKIQLVNLIDKSLPPINGDDVQVQQVFVNLIQNAMDAMEENGTLEIFSVLKESTIEVHFKDNGIGMTKEQMSKVFDPFFTTKPVGQGTGLGLYISYNIMKKFNGDIQIISNGNHGTDVVVIFPYYKQRGEVE